MPVCVNPAFPMFFRKMSVIDSPGESHIRHSSVVGDSQRESMTGIFQRIAVIIRNEPHPSPPQPRFLGREGLGEVKKQPLNHE